jgi:DNA-binding HxlR family transcriptional regulator
MAKAKRVGDVCNAQCSSRKILELLAEKWALLVIHRLSIAPSRTSQLRRQIGGVSEKMLIQTLRKLERHGFVERIDFGEVPPRVEYRLTELGRSLGKAVLALDTWVEQNFVDVVVARGRFDAKLARPNRAAQASR